MATTRRLSALVLTALLAGAVTACGDDTGSDATPADAAGTTGPTGAAEADLPAGDQAVEVDPADFTVDIDNRYWPMEPGTRWTYREINKEGEELRVVVTVSTETKEIANGVTARIVRDTVTRGGELVEDTVDWYAQDAAGNVWYLGEDTAEFEDGEIATREGSFEAGVDGALPGVIMPGQPRDGMRYRQEYYEGEAEDDGEVLGVDEQAEVPSGHYDDVLLTKDTSAIEPDVLEYKLYAPGVGPVLVLGVSGGGGREELLRTERVDDAVAQAAGTAPLGEDYEE